MKLKVKFKKKSQFSKKLLLSSHQSLMFNQLSSQSLKLLLKLLKQLLLLSNKNHKLNNKRMLKLQLSKLKLKNQFRKLKLKSQLLRFPKKFQLRFQSKKAANHKLLNNNNKVNNDVCMDMFILAYLFIYSFIFVFLLIIDSTILILSFIIQKKINNFLYKDKVKKW